MNHSALRSSLAALARSGPLFGIGGIGGGPFSPPFSPPLSPPIVWQRTHFMLNSFLPAACGSDSSILANGMPGNLGSPPGGGGGGGSSRLQPSATNNGRRSRAARQHRENVMNGSYENG